MEDFPANSKSNPKKKAAAKKAQPQEKPELEPVVEAEASQKKHGLASRFKQVFLGADLHGAAAYIIGEVTIPAIRDMLFDSGSRGLERFVYGETQTRKRHARHGSGRTTYNQPVRRGGMASRSGPPGQAAFANRQVARPNPNNIIYEAAADAQQVLDIMNEVLGNFGRVSVADQKELSGIPMSYVDNQWGWFNLDTTSIVQTREGWVIDIPNPEPLGDE